MRRLFKYCLLIFCLFILTGAFLYAEEGKDVVPEINGLPVKIAPRPAGTEMVLIPAGPFLMGSSVEDIFAIQEQWSGQERMSLAWFDDETPQHSYYLPDYYIDRYEVTNRQYRKFQEATSRRRPAFWDDPSLNGDDQPVVGVNWADADAYCWWAKKRLPYEAEWEKAARGVDGRRYPWGNKWQPDYLNGRHSGLSKTAQVGSFSRGASPYGALDMAGNVWEWCIDWYDTYIYRFSPKTRSPRYNRIGYRVIRGGSYLEKPFELRATYRYRFKQQYNFISVGFRCVKDP